jgi:DeoR family transcriptional regulator of aga operon
MKTPRGFWDRETDDPAVRAQRGGLAGASGRARPDEAGDMNGNQGNGWAPRYQDAPGRRRWILGRLREAGFQSVADLAGDLGVSQMTVRRDLHLLETGGRVRTVHGGVSLAPGMRGPFHRADGNGEAGRRIARCTAHLVGDDDTIVIDAGAAGYQLIHALPPSFRGTVITHSMLVMQLLAERPAPPRLIALGGEFSPARQAFFGPATLEAITRLRARTFFLSIAAADQRGLYARSGSEASVECRLMDVADEVVLLAPYEVFTGSAPALVGSLHRLAATVTDRSPPEAVAMALTRAGTAIHVATPIPDQAWTS